MGATLLLLLHPGQLCRDVSIHCRVPIGRAHPQSISIPKILPRRSSDAHHSYELAALWRLHSNSLFIPVNSAKTSVYIAACLLVAHILDPSVYQRYSRANHPTPINPLANPSLIPSRPAGCISWKRILPAHPFSWPGFPRYT